MKIELITPHSHILTSIIYAIQGARFAKKSLGKSDSDELLGNKDYELALKLAKTPNASGHDKFLQQIPFIVDISWSRFMHQESDTYRIGVSKQSESTMHTLTKETITIDNFDTDKYSEIELNYILPKLNEFIKYHQELKLLFEQEKLTDTEYRNILKSLLPESFIQKRRFSMNYAVMKTMYSQRKNHRNYEWIVFFEYAKNNLPYSELFLN